MHTIIVGMTDSGKSTLAKALCASYRRRGFATIVLDPTRAPDWAADYQTHDMEEFLHHYWHADTEYCMAFFDESGVSIGHFNRDAQAPATMGRKKGHLNHFIVQRLTQISPNVRGMCSELYLFRCSSSDARTLADEFNCKQLAEAGTLAMPNDGTGRGAEFFHLRSGGQCERKNLFKVKEKKHGSDSGISGPRSDGARIDSARSETDSERSGARAGAQEERGSGAGNAAESDGAE